MLWLDFKTDWIIVCMIGLDSFGKFIDFTKSAQLDINPRVETSIVKVLIE